MQLQFFASKKEAKVPCKHFGEESICSIMFFFSNQSSFVPFSTIQLCSPALCPSLTKAWIVFRVEVLHSSEFRWKRFSRAKDLPIWTRGHYPTRNQMYLFIYVFFRCWNKVFSMYMSCTFNMFVYLCISQILLLGFLTIHLAQKTWYQFNIIWN